MFCVTVLCIHRRGAVWEGWAEEGASAPCLLSSVISVHCRSWVLISASWIDALHLYSMVYIGFLCWNN